MPMKTLKTPKRLNKADRGERSGELKAKAAGQASASRRYLPWLLLGLCLGLFLLLLYPSLSIRHYRYAPGDVVEHDIKAPQDFFVEDEAASQDQQRRAAAAVLTVYDHDTTLVTSIVERVETAFGQMRQWLQAASDNADLGGGLDRQVLPPGRVRVVGQGVGMREPAEPNGRRRRGG